MSYDLKLKRLQFIEAMTYFFNSMILLTLMSGGLRINVTRPQLRNINISKNKSAANIKINYDN